MYNIELLEKEHENILTLTDVMENMAISIMNSKKADSEDLKMIVEFIRNYSDKQHHGKEEKILFKYMIENLGPVAEKLVQNGMLVEHDLARLYVGGIVECIKMIEENDVSDLTLITLIGHLLEYANLLRRHANKENDVAYPFAERKLSSEILSKCDEETRKFEEENAENRITQLNNLQLLKEKYLS